MPRWTEQAIKKHSERITGNTWASVNKGEKNHYHKLTESEVIKIYISSRTYRILALQFNVSKSTIQHIKNGYTWWWLTGEEQRFN